MKKTTIWMMALLLCWGCGPGEEEEGLDKKQLGRYEYLWLTDTDNFKFYYANRTGFEELVGVNKGVGRIKSEFCKFVPGIFFSCEKPNLPLPFFNFTKDQVEIALFLDGKIVSQKIPYKVEGDTVIIGEEPDVYIMKLTTENHRPSIVFEYRVAFRSGRNAAVDVQLLQEGTKIENMVKDVQQLLNASPLDTIAIGIVREKYIRD
jgi:hypothetical protein